MSWKSPKDNPLKGSAVPRGWGRGSGRSCFLFYPIFSDEFMQKLVVKYLDGGADGFGRVSRHGKKGVFFFFFLQDFHMNITTILTWRFINIGDISVFMIVAKTSKTSCRWRGDQSIRQQAHDWSQFQSLRTWRIGNVPILPANARIVGSRPPKRPIYQSNTRSQFGVTPSPYSSLKCCIMNLAVGGKRWSW